MRKLLCFAALGLATSAVPAPASTFSVDGGTITTTDTDTNLDSTGAGGGFELKANSTTTGDAIVISNVTINNTTASPNGRAIDIGYSLASTGSYSVIMNGSTLISKAGSGVSAFSANSSGGTVSFDSTGGAPNTIFGDDGILVVGNTPNGSASIKTGADTVTTTGLTGEILYAVANGTGTASIDSVGATLTSAGRYGISGDAAFGAVIIGGQNGGIQSSIYVPNGDGIYTANLAPTNITLGVNGVINAQTGIYSSSSTLATVDTFGTIMTTGGPAIRSDIAILESGSSTIGEVRANTINIYAGADITGTTFNSETSTRTINLRGAGADTLNLSTIGNIQQINKSDAGSWTLSGSSPSVALSATAGTIIGTTSSIPLLPSLQAGAVLNFSQAFSGNYNGVISGGGSVTISGTGTVTFTNSNTYSGGTAISAGILVISNNTNLGAASGPVTLNGGTLEFTNNAVMPASRNFNVGLGGGTFSAGDPNISAPGGSTSIAGVISGPGHVTYTGFGGLTLTGNNTYTGGTTIYEGAILVGNGGTTGSIVGDVISGVATSNSGINFNRSDNITFGGNISGAGYVAQYGTGTLTLTGNNTYGAYTTVLSGRLAFASDSNVGTGPIQIYSGTVQYNASFTSALNYRLSSGAIDTNGNTVTLSGNVFTDPSVNVGFGYGGLTKIGSGTLILAGSDIYQGPTQISGGTLQIGNGGTTGSTGTNLSITDNGVLAYKRSDNITVSDVISGTGSLAQGGTNIVTLTGNNTYSGGSTISQGTLQVGNGGVAGTLGSGAITDNATLAIDRSDAYVISSVISGSGSLIQIGPGSTVLTGANTYSGGTTVSAGVLQIGTPTTGGSIVGNVADNATLMFDRSDAYSFSGNISGSGRVWIAGQGNATFTGTESVTGGTTVFVNSTLNIGNGGTSGSVAGNIDTDAGGHLVFNRSDGILYAGTISGSGTLTQSGTGTLVLTGNNTYSGGTIVAHGTLSLGSNGAAGTGAITSTGSIVDYANGVTINNPISINSNTTQLQALSGVTATQAAVVSETGGSRPLEKIGAGTLIFTASNSYSGGTTVSGGTLSISSDTNLGATSGGVTLNGGNLQITANNLKIAGTRSFSLGANGGTIDVGTNTDFIAGTIGGSGSLIKTGTGNLYLTGSGNSWSGGTTVLAGVLGIGDTISDGSLPGNVTVASGGALNFGTHGNFTYGGVISGAGRLAQQATNTLILTGDSTLTGGTSIYADGTIQLGNGGTTGSLTGSLTTYTSNASLAFDHANAVTFAGVISGIGGVRQIGLGTTTLSALNTYTGPTTIAAGTLNVTGSITGSAVSVANGGALSGTGKTGSVSVASGGALSPGAGTALGTLTIQGNLVLASAATTQDYITPSASSIASVSGTANINGFMVANASSGTYAVGQHYTLLSATGALNGTYSSLTTPGLPGYVKGRLSYDANDVYLYLDPNALTPLLGPAATGGEKSLAAGVDTAIRAGASLNGGFLTLFNLSGDALDAALDQVSGQIANGAFEAANQSFTPFLALLTQIGGQGGNGPAVNFAPQASYDMPGAPHPAQATRELRFWGSVFGGHADISGDAATGAHDLTSGLVGLAGGVETQLDDAMLLGASLAGGHDSFSTGDGHGGSDDVMIALYGRHTLLDRGYLSGALAYGWHDVSTRRIVTVSGTDVLTANFAAHDFGGRIEAGYGFMLDNGSALTPFAAFAGQEFHAPAYGETAASGSSAFALSYAARSTDASHTELGTHYGRNFIGPDDATIALDASAAWEHELNDNPLALAAFQALPGSGFAVYGTRPATDTALLGFGLHTQHDGDLSFGFHGDARVSTGTTILTGTADLSVQW